MKPHSIFGVRLSFCAAESRGSALVFLSKFASERDFFVENEPRNWAFSLLLTIETLGNGPMN